MTGLVKLEYLCFLIVLFVLVKYIYIKKRHKNKKKRVEKKIVIQQRKVVNKFGGFKEKNKSSAKVMKQLMR